MRHARVIDPACGSGHFLLAAARRIATRVARHRHGGAATAAQYRHALRDVARRCIFGVDRNPMAVELTRVALWIETVDPGLPLGFLDANIRCGDALFGAFDLTSLDAVPEAAYRPLTGDDRAAAKYYDKRNRDERRGQGALDFAGGGGALPPVAPLAAEAEALRALPEDTPAEVEEKRRRFAAAEAGPGRYGYKLAADLQAAAFLLPKTEVPTNRNAPAVPTTAHLRDALAGQQVYGPLVEDSQGAAAEARAFHWPLAFPDVWARGGFDAVLGNPPWDVVQLNEEEYFGQKLPEIAELAGAARKRAIAALERDRPEVFEAYQIEKRRFEAANEFARASGRFELSSRGKVNTYALFADLFIQLTSARGQAGIIVPTGVATDASTAPFFAHLVSSRRLAQLIDFENREGLFPAVDSRMKFCILITGHAVQKSIFSFFLTNTNQIVESERCFALTAVEISRINPNTGTAPIFRSRSDADLTARIYHRVPVFLEEARGQEGNNWKVWFHTRIWNMTEDSSWFRTAAELHHAGYAPHGSMLSSISELNSKYQRYCPLYEAKMVHQYDHRWATHDATQSRDTSLIEKTDCNFEPLPRYWVPEQEADARLQKQGWVREWLVGWRNITNVTNERTSIFSIMPKVAVGNTEGLLFTEIEPVRIAVLVANLNSMVLDYVARQKIGGTHLNYHYINQLPIIPPNFYSEENIAFIASRVLELTYTSHSMEPFARDLGHDGPPFAWDENRRALLRAELDACYARLYGLTRDDLRYVLDPIDARGSSYPSETFRGLKANELRCFGEYRTARLVLAAWDAEASGLRTAMEPRL